MYSDRFNGQPERNCSEGEYQLLKDCQRKPQFSESERLYRKLNELKRKIATKKVNEGILSDVRSLELELSNDGIDESTRICINTQLASIKHSLTNQSLDTAN